jgi:hypothetical protein
MILCRKFCKILSLFYLFCTISKDIGIVHCFYEMCVFIYSASYFNSAFVSDIIDTQAYGFIVD